MAGGVGDSVDFAKGKTATRPSTVSLTSENDYNHVVNGIRMGDFVCLKRWRSNKVLLRIDFDPITGVISLYLPHDGKYSVHTGRESKNSLKSRDNWG
ncbi:MAG: hypothetical protein Q8Q89_00700 [bacterium]|nr:hypothetical protein [bacterium]